MTDVVEIATMAEYTVAVTGARVVIDFARRYGCVPCQRLEPHFKAAAGAPVLEDIEFYKVYLDEAEPALLEFAMNTLGIKGTPTIIEFRNEVVHGKVEGRTAPVIIKELSA